MKVIRFLLILSAVYICINSHAENIALAADDNVHTTITVNETRIYALAKSGDVYCWDYGNGLEKVKITGNAIELSRNYLIKEDGTLWCCDNAFQLKYIGNDVCAVNAGTAHTLFIKNDGSLWGIGDNSCGQLGQGMPHTDNNLPISDEMYTRENIHHIKYIPEYYNEPVKIMDNVKKAKAGMSYSLVLTEAGSVYTFGSEIYGELADGRNVYINKTPNLVMNGISDIFLSGAACFAIDAQQNCYRWGSNYIDFIGSTDNITEPITYSENTKYVWNKPGYNYVIDTDSDLWILGDTEHEGTIRLSDLTILNVPAQALSNVDCVVGTDRSESYDITVILTLDGDLYLVENINQDENIMCNLSMTLLNKNIRLSTEVSENREFFDLNSCSENENTAIENLCRGGIIQGITDNEFMPYKEITRAETAALLLRIINKTDETEECNYSDITRFDWYYDTIGVCQKYGIIDGYDDNTFRGEAVVSDLQLAVLASRTLRNEGTEIDHEIKAVNNIPDSIPDWARNDILYALNHGLITEQEALELSDKGMTRGEAAVILYRLYCII